MIRLGLCCTFQQEPIKFRTTTAAYLTRIDKPYSHLGTIIEHNILSLQQALYFCAQNGIGAFRINSQILPLCSHPDWKYEIQDLPNNSQITTLLSTCLQLKKHLDVRLLMHPDQFVVLNSPKADVVKNSIAELNYQATFAGLVGVDVINIHGGGVYGNKLEALARFKSHFLSLPENIKKLLTVENDDKCYTPEDLLPVCEELQIPLVYDVHHHRCLKDSLSIQAATTAALKTWNRESVFHISSPIGGWDSTKIRQHHDFIEPTDFPKCWENLHNTTIEVEAKSKEVAVQALQKFLKEKHIKIWLNNSKKNPSF